MTAKQVARSNGLWSGSNGQLMKTDRARLGFDPTGEGIGVLHERGFDGLFDLVGREA